MTIKNLAEYFQSKKAARSIEHSVAYHELNMAIS